MTPHDNTNDEWMRELLEDAVADVEPQEALDVIRSRTGRVRPFRRARVWGTAGAGLAVAATLAAIALATTSEAPQTEPPPIGTSSTPSTPGATLQARVPVYYLGEVKQHSERGDVMAGLRLYREWHDVSGVEVGTSSPDQVATAALHEMLTAAADDPDYTSLWQGVDVTSVTEASGVVTVDLSGPVEQLAVSADAAEPTIQQLVYTVQGALAVAKDKASADRVRILVDGSGVDQLWGQVDVSQPVERAPQDQVQAPIWITSIEDGATVSSPVTVEGLAQAFEATVSWRVTGGGAVVRQGTAMADEGAPAFAPYSFQVELDPGSYVIEVFEASALDGTPIHTDSKRFTVK